MNGGGRAYFNVNGKMLTSNQMTYDDLITVVKDFEKRNGRLPRKEDYVTINNLPCSKTVEKIIKRNGKVRSEFYNDIGDYVNATKNETYHSNKTPTSYSRRNNRVKKEVLSTYKISESFSIESVKYKVLNIIKSEKDIIFDEYYLIDNFGYRYYTQRQNIVRALIGNNVFPKFTNIYNPICMIHNLNLHMKENNCIYYVYQYKDVTFRGDIIKVKSIYGDIESVSLESIILTPDRYTEEGRKKRYKYIKKHNISKEEVVKELIEYQNYLQRPLLCHDIDCETTEDRIGTGPILKYWGSFGNMVDDTNIYSYLKYSDGMLDALKQYQSQENKEKITFLNRYPTEFFLKIVEMVCDNVKNCGRTKVSSNDFGTDKIPISYQEVKEYLDKKGYSIGDVVRQNGCSFNYSEFIRHYTFDDGEKVLSGYEYTFSYVLKKLGYVFKIDYFKDIKYSEFIPNYTQGYRCDYILVKGTRKLIIEICGFLSTKQAVNSYLNNIEIQNNIVEKYRLKMADKRELLENNFLDYIFIMGEDLNGKYFEKVITDFYGG